MLDSMDDSWVFDKTCASCERAFWDGQEHWHEVTRVATLDRRSGQYRIATRSEFVAAVEQMYARGDVLFPLTEGVVYTLDDLAYWSRSRGSHSEQILSKEGFVRSSIRFAGLGTLVGAFADVSESSPGDNDLPVRDVQSEIRLRYLGRRLNS